MALFHALSRVPYVALPVILAAGLAGCATTPRPSTPTLETIVLGEMTQQGVPGLAVGVLRRGERVLVQGIGQANLEHAVPVTTATVFQSGSLAKQFTAVAVMLQVDAGRLRLDDAITRYFPDAPATWQAITVRHLLTHTSGIPDYAEGMVNTRQDYTEDEMVRMAYRLPLAFEAGARWSYNDTGYVLLGAIVRKASGQFYGDVLRSQVFSPLGMQTARVISEEDIVMHRAAGYRRVGQALKNQAWVAPQITTTADGSLYLSLQDWLIWAQALRERAILRPESWAQVFTPVRLNSGKTFPYGLGWELSAEGQGPAWYRHSGAWQGFQAAFVHATEADLTVIVLANLAEAQPMRLAERLAHALEPTLVWPAPRP